MVITKALGLWLFVVGIIWAFGLVWIHLSMMTMTEPVLPMPIHLAIGFAGPAILIIGAILLMAAWQTRVGSVLVLIACAWLTWQIAPDCVFGIVQPREPLEPPKLYIAVIVSLVFVLLADLAAIFAFRHVRKTSNQSLEPTSGRRDDQI